MKEMGHVWSGSLEFSPTSLLGRELARWCRARKLPETVPSAMLELVHTADLLDIPAPGLGRTLERFEALATFGSHDLSLARLVEGHLDALEIMREAGFDDFPRGRPLGVWTAGPLSSLKACRVSGGWRLTGVKHWCSGAPTIGGALVTAWTEDFEENGRLFLIDLASSGVEVDPASWQAVGMVGSETCEVQFRDFFVPEDAVVGEPGFYLNRAGFWAGAIGVAAVWIGGAHGVAGSITASMGDKMDPHRLASLGAIMSRLWSMRMVIESAASQIDSVEEMTPGSLEPLALAVRHLAESGCLEVLELTNRVTGPTPLGRDRTHAQRVADLPVYLRQSHGDADLAHLARTVVESSPHLRGLGKDLLTSVSTSAPGSTQRSSTTQTHPQGQAGRSFSITHSYGSTDQWLTRISDSPWDRIQWGEPSRVLVISPHPDDEVLGMGGSIAQLVREGFDLSLVAVTDGEGAFPDLDEVQRENLARVRERERDRALKRLGVTSLDVVALHLPDGRVSSHEADLADALIKILSAAVEENLDNGRPPGFCLSTWRHDGHPDHNSTAEAAKQACSEVGTDLLQFPVWAWNWMSPDDPRFPWKDVRIAPLSLIEHAQKVAAISEFKSQVAPWKNESAPVLSGEMIRRCSRQFEVVVV